MVEDFSSFSHPWNNSGVCNANSSHLHSAPLTEILLEIRDSVLDIFALRFEQEITIGQESDRRVKCKPGLKLNISFL